MQMVEKKPWYAGDVDVESLRARFGDFSHHLHMHDTASLALITPGANRVRMKGPKFAAWAANLYATDANKPPACWSMAKAAAGGRSTRISPARRTSLGWWRWHGYLGATRAYHSRCRVHVCPSSVRGGWPGRAFTQPSWRLGLFGAKMPRQHPIPMSYRPCKAIDCRDPL